MDGWTWDFCLEAEVCSQLSYRSSHPFSGQGGKARNGEAVQGLQCVQGGKMCFHKACSQAASNSTLFVWVKGCPAASRVGGWVHGWGEGRGKPMYSSQRCHTTQQWPSQLGALACAAAAASSSSYLTLPSPLFFSLFPSSLSLPSHPSIPHPPPPNSLPHPTFSPPPPQSLNHRPH